MTTFQHPPCPVCARTANTREWPQAEDIYECLDCGITFYPDEPDVMDREDTMLSNITANISATGFFHV